MLVVNGFDRISGPAVIDTPDAAGFDLSQDPGVPYLYDISLCGAQQNFSRKEAGRRLGESSDKYEGMKIIGNTFDYPFVHGKAIQAAGGYSFVSCSDEAVENGFVRLADYPITDLIFGADRRPFSNTLQQLITSYCQKGGNLILSGSYIGSNMNSPTALNFTENILKYSFGGSMLNSTSGEIYGAGTRFNIPRTINEQTYAVPAPDCLTPVAPAYSAFVYNPGNYSAGIAYKGTYRTFVLGFPFESIQGVKERARVMSAILGFFGNK